MLHITGLQSEYYQGEKRVQTIFTDPKKQVHTFVQFCATDKLPKMFL